MKNTVFCSHFPPIFLVSQACAFSSVRQFLWYLPSYLHITWIYYSFFSLVIICSFFRLWRSWKSRISHFFPPLLTSLLCTTFSNPYSLSLTDYDYTIIVLDESSVFYIQFSSVSQLCPTLQPHELQHTRLPCPSPTPRVHPNLCPLSLVMSSSHLTLCRTLLLLPSIFPSIRVFSNKLALCIRWPKYWSFSFSVSPSNEHPGLIPFL